MSNRDTGQEFLDGIREIKGFKKGKNKLMTHSSSGPSPPKVIRQKLRLSQSAFASLMGISPGGNRDQSSRRNQEKKHTLF